LSFIEAHTSERLDDSQAHIVRHGHFLERDIQRRASGQYAFANRVCDRTVDVSTEGKRKLLGFLYLRLPGKRPEPAGILLDLKALSLADPPLLAIGDCALSF
jgi:hypothetical protein